MDGGDRLASPDAQGEAERQGHLTEADLRALARFWQSPSLDDAHDEFCDVGVHFPRASSHPVGIPFGQATLVKSARRLGPAPTTPRLPWLLPLRKCGRHAPLYLVHALDGEAHAYGELVASLGADQPVYALRAPGLEVGEPLVVRLEQLAGLHVRILRRHQPYGPYRLAGWSMGGVVAYEMARRLHSAGEEVEQLLLFDSYPPQLLNRAFGEPPALALAHYLSGLCGITMPIDVSRLPDTAPDAAVAVLLHARLQGYPPGQADPARLERLARVFQANLAAWHAYAPGPYRGRLTLLRAAGTPGELADNGWRGVCGHALTVQTVPGDHYSLLRPPHVQALAASVDQGCDPDF